MCGLKGNNELTWRLKRPPALSYALLNIESMKGLRKFETRLEEERAWQRELL
jgi:hypothetical protein